MKGKIISRSLQEAGITPKEGMQVYIFKVIATIRRISAKEFIYLNQDGKEIQSFWLVDELKTLLVEYEELIHIVRSSHYQLEGSAEIFKGIEKDGKWYFPKQITLSLRHSDWQTAIDQGLVDSGKEVEWNEITAVEQDGIPLARIAELIPQQDDLEKLKEQARDYFKKLKLGIFFGEDPQSINADIKSRVFAWIAGYKAAKSEQQQDIEQLILKADAAAVVVAENIKSKLNVNEQALFIAGFQECIKQLESIIEKRMDTEIIL